MVNLKANPYYLSDEDCKWVEDTIAGMSDEEKVGQLFFQLTASHDEEYLKELMEKYHLGGCRYNPAPGKAIQEQNRKLQKYAKIPVFIACNTESGGNGACADGTTIGSGVKIAGPTRKNTLLPSEKCPTKRPLPSDAIWLSHRSAISPITGKTRRSSAVHSETIRNVSPR